MNPERFRWLAALIYAHPDHQLVGRTRLQKETWLLQRKDMPSGYDFRIHYYGIYSDDVQADINLLERFGYVTEEVEETKDGRPFSIFTATAAAHLPEIEPFQGAIEIMAESSPLTLELAATYDAYRHAGLNHGRAIAELRRTKPTKCAPPAEDLAIDLLKRLRLPAE